MENVKEFDLATVLTMTTDYKVVEDFHKVYDLAHIAYNILQIPTSI